MRREKESMSFFFRADRRIKKTGRERTPHCSCPSLRTLVDSRARPSALMTSSWWATSPMFLGRLCQRATERGGREREGIRSGSWMRGRAFPPPASLTHYLSTQGWTRAETAAMAVGACRWRACELALWESARGQKKEDGVRGARPSRSQSLLSPHAAVCLFGVACDPVSRCARRQLTARLWSDGHPVAHLAVSATKCPALVPPWWARSHSEVETHGCMAFFEARGVARPRHRGRSAHHTHAATGRRPPW